MREWFKHDIYTTTDPKIIIIMSEFGGIGYAFFWRIVEMLYASDRGDLVIDQTLILSLATQLKTTTEHLKDILKRFMDLDIFTQNIVSMSPTKGDKMNDESGSKSGSKPPKMIQNDPDHLDQKADHFLQNDPIVLTSKRVKEIVIEKTNKWRQYKENQVFHGKAGGRPIEPMKVGSKGYESQEVDLKDNNKDLRSKQLKSNIIKIRSKKHWSNFEIFWKFYPKRVAKLIAAKVWSRKHLDDKLEIILDDLKKRSSDESWQAGYIPNPSNYLNNERWTDEPQKPIRPKKKLADELFEKNFKIAFGEKPQFQNGRVITAEEA